MITKSSPEAISLGGGLIVACISEIIGINDNNITSRIPNYITSPSNLRYVVNKSRETTFIRISGFVCNYPCSMSCDKGYRSGLGRLVKEIYLWGGE